MTDGSGIDHREYKDEISRPSGHEEPGVSVFYMSGNSCGIT